MISSLILKIKRRENYFYALLYKLASYIRSFNLPTIKIIHLPLYYFDCAVKVSARWAIQTFWSVPLFKARCETVGKNLRLPNGIPLIVGHHLKIYLGDNVRILRSTIGAGKIVDSPVLRIGNNSGVGYGTTISVAKEVVIGDNTMIGPNCIIMDNDDHPISPQKRLAGESVSIENIYSVMIGNNVWVGSNVAILKGVTIGDNSIIATHSVITKDVPPNTIYAGYPARPTVRDIDKL